MMRKQICEMHQNFVGEKHPDTVNAMNNLAFILDNIGDIHVAHKIR